MYFLLCSRVLYGPAENLKTSEFYEKFSDWLEECTRTGDVTKAFRSVSKANQSAQLQTDICMTTRAPAVSTGSSVNLFIINGGRGNEKN